MTGLRKLTKGSPTEKLKFLFDVYDADGKVTLNLVYDYCTQAYPPADLLPFLFKYVSLHQTNGSVIL